MARRTLAQRLARWHIWLGWIAALPLIVWIASGLFMALRPIEEVRGEQFRRPSRPFASQVLVPPQLDEPVTRLSLVQEGSRAVWVTTGADLRQARYSADSGARIGPVGVMEAHQLAEAAFAGPAPLSAIRHFSAAQAPLDLRRPRPSWQATFADGTHLYIDADTGEVLALRTRWWRAYDFMWGLHILDPLGRENSSNLWLWLLAPLALATSLFGTTLLFRRRRSKKG